MMPRTQMKFLADPAWSCDQASWWPCYILNTRGPQGGSGCSGKVCEEGQHLEKAGLFFGEIPWAGVAVLERTEPGVLLWKQSGHHQVSVAALSQQHSKMFYCKGFISFPGLQPALAMCTAWIVKYTLSGISDRRKWALSAFSCHFCNGLARCWSRASSLCQNKQHFWGCAATPGTVYLVKGLALEMHEQLRLHFLNGVHFVITEEKTLVGI